MTDVVYAIECEECDKLPQARPGDIVTAVKIKGRHVEATHHNVTITRQVVA